VRLLFFLLIVLAGAGGSLYLLSEPVRAPADALPDHTPDLDNGRVVFFAAVGRGSQIRNNRRIIFRVCFV
jgi:hypothetical protein